MYYEHFRLSGEPFSLTPDPAFLFLSEKHREAMAAVQYGLLNGRGFITLIGEVGTGKTTILYTVLSQLGPEVATAYVPYAAHTFDDLLTVNMRLFADLNQRTGLIERVPLLKNTRVTLGINNVFDARQRVTDSTGAVPLRYQPFLIDPTGRFFELELRKLF